MSASHLHPPLQRPSRTSAQDDMTGRISPMITAVNIDGGKGGQVGLFCGTLAQVLVPYGESASCP